MSGAVTFTLPAPPSVNNLFATVGRRRVRTPRYMGWIAAAGWTLRTQRPGRITGAWQAEIVLPAKMRGDLDNRVKAILDLLVLHGVVDDDRHCKRLSVEKTGAADSVTVTLMGVAS